MQEVEQRREQLPRIGSLISACKAHRFIGYSSQTTPGFPSFYQTEDLDLGNLGDPRYQTITVRANIRRPARAQDAWQDTAWSSAFAAFTFNFMDDKASLDVGARYTHISKQSFIQGYGATWIYDTDPRDAPNDVDILAGGPGDGLAQGTRHDNDCEGNSF